jgi:hypothetical protein
MTTPIEATARKVCATKNFNTVTENRVLVKSSQYTVLEKKVSYQVELGDTAVRFWAPYSTVVPVLN